MGLYVYYEDSPSEDVFLQRCYYACVQQGPACLGFSDEQGCPRGAGRCCHLHTANTEYAFYSPTTYLHLKTGGGLAAAGATTGGDAIANPFAPAAGRSAAVTADGLPVKTPLASVRGAQAAVRAEAVVALSASRARVGPNCAATGFLLLGCGPLSATLGARSVTAAECDAVGGLLAGCETVHKSPPALAGGADNFTSSDPKLLGLVAQCEDSDKVSVSAVVGAVVGAVIGTALLTALVMYAALVKPLGAGGAPASKGGITKQPSLNFHNEATGVGTTSAAAPVEVAVDVK